MYWPQDALGTVAERGTMMAGERGKKVARGKVAGGGFKAQLKRVAAEPEVKKAVKRSKSVAVAPSALAAKAAAPSKLVTGKLPSAEKKPGSAPSTGKRAPLLASGAGGEEVVGSQAKKATCNTDYVISLGDSAAPASAAAAVKKQRVKRQKAEEDSEVRYDSKHAAKASGGKKRGKGKGVEEAAEGAEGEADDVMSGNDDDEGSVVSAVLEEDICGTCGIPTMLEGEACPDVVLCDVCDGEYHLGCEGLSQLPQGDFTCSACVRQTALFADLNFDVSSSFPNDEHPAMCSLVLALLYPYPSLLFPLQPPLPHLYSRTPTSPLCPTSMPHTSSRKLRTLHTCRSPTAPPIPHAPLPVHCA
jgi:hypothetical protein